MIRKEKFWKIKSEIDTAIEEAFEYAKNHEKNENDFILFLGNAEYKKSYENKNVSPYFIDDRENFYKDDERLKFLNGYIARKYNFTVGKLSVPEVITLELMVYTHTWESKPYLRLLKKLANLCEGLDYDWDVKIPDYKKYEYIQEGIGSVFANQGLKIADIIAEGYHSSLRNAFAHSEYVFNSNHSELILTNYKGNNWEIENINYHDWSLKFWYSALLCQSFNRIFKEQRTDLAYGQQKYACKLKSKDGQERNGFVVYDDTKDAFTATLS
ncbi:hypothetical protein [Aquimarina algicola]|uniref:Uncharacterized protein n=1 Tax=Aquimarina algicola TaxID=2589995 RepID=A0A504IY43_9FLAO|nr:hypothetical protein [Aquimarina algicola]TPN82954.1 hypothetical protein FHK87_21245 [Aquimarina algicola]